MRKLLLIAGAVCATSTTAPAAFALGLGVSTPSVTLANLGPGLTASGSGALVVSGVLTPWTLKVADTSGNAGHLAPAAVGCTGSQTQTANALSASASGLLATTNGAGAVLIAATSKTVATGVAADTVTVAYSLAVAHTELMRAGCVYSTIVTYTVQ